MPTSDNPQEELPVETGLGSLVLEPSNTENALQELAEQARIEREQREAEDEAARAAIRSAAQAEERRAADLAARPEEEPAHVSEARRINDQIHQRIMEARAQARKAEEPKPPQPASKHIMEQTRREMEEGALQSRWHEDQRKAALANRPSPPRQGGHTEAGGGNVEVFRPQDYIPDPVKNQGHIKVTT